MNELRSGRYAIVRKYVLTLILLFLISWLLITTTTDASISDTVNALIRGSVIGKISLGATLTAFGMLILNGLAFTVGLKAGYFNVGITGDMIVGAIAVAILGVNFAFLPRIVLLTLCIIAGITAGALWALIPALLKTKLSVNEILSSIMLNSVAIYITDYVVSGPLRSGGALARTFDVGARLTQLLPPTRLTTGLLISLGVWAAMLWVMKYTKFGFNMKTLGQNPKHAEYAGVNPSALGIKAMLLSGGIAGLAGSIIVLGDYGYFLVGFSDGLASRGLLIALLVKGEILLLPIAAFFISALSTGSLMLQSSVGVPKDLADTLTALLIVIASMDYLFMYKSKINISILDPIKKKLSGLIRKKEETK